MKKKTDWKKAVGFLVRKGHRFDLNGGWDVVTPLLEEEAGIRLTRLHDLEQSMKARGKIAWKTLLRDRKVSGVRKAVNVVPMTFRAPKLSRTKADKFYRSYDWRKLRLTILMRDGRRCACCGATPENGVAMHVDHIKPLRLNWALRLDPNNLQVLCELCNHGKGNWDDTDWRAPNDGAA